MVGGEARRNFTEGAKSIETENVKARQINLRNVSNIPSNTHFLTHSL